MGAAGLTWVALEAADTDASTASASALSLHDKIAYQMIQIEVKYSNNYHGKCNLSPSWTLKIPANMNEALNKVATQRLRMESFQLQCN
jgi:hypothetical protein